METCGATDGQHVKHYDGSGYLSYTPHILLTMASVALLLLCVGVASGFGKFSVYMEEKCGGTVHVDVFGKHAGRLRPTRTAKYKPNMRCTVTIHTAESHRFVIVFRRLDIEFEPLCDDDYLQIHDGNSTSAPTISGLPQKMCGEEKPEGDYVTSGHSMTVMFRSDSWYNDYGFDFLFTIFHTGTCVEGEMKCANERCVSMYLECDGWNNCGDDSDECPLSTVIILAVVIGIIFFFLIATSMILFIRRRQRCKSRKEGKEDLTYCIHDHIHNIHNHGQVDKDPDYTRKDEAMSQASVGLPW
ncbi:membrane frizzled-related protein-like [Ylistrum balloti]|uniref:membrane frizzled-related protein-like n=1 Tax=Ylistrum balloti TaxID=509963 RepID=UPI002905E754|nr:membrane frizzled-related protein-like [Ylistrum balloti]